MFSGIADSVSQLSDHSKGHHTYLPSSVDGFRDKIDWSRQNDSLKLSIIRTGGYPRNDEELKINLETNTGIYSLFDRDYNTFYSYNWDENGNGNLTKIVYNWNEEVVEEDFYSW